MTKTCQQCGTEFARPRGYSAKQWASAKNCSRACRDRAKVGTTHTPAARAIISAVQRGRKRGPLSVTTRQKIGAALRGRKQSPAHLKALSAVRRGKNSGPLSRLWIDGRTPENHRIRNSPEMLDFRRSCMERDNYTCVHCGVRGGDLHVDHIKQFALYPELRFDINNGRTLCVPCHEKTLTYGRRRAVA